MASDSHTIGRWMVWLCWLIVLFFLTLFFKDQLEKRQNPNQQIESLVDSRGIAEIVLTRNPAGHYVASGFINNHAVVFLLDTGATDVSVPGQVAKRIGLSKGRPLIYQTANGNTRGYATRLDSISLGDIELHNVRGGINPSMQSEHILLGMTFLKHLEFSQRGNKLTLRQYPIE